MAGDRDKTPPIDAAGPAGSRRPTRSKHWRPSLKKNIVYSGLGQGALLVLQILSIRSVFTGLGQDVFGIIAFCQMISFLVSTFFDKTTRFSLVKQIAHAQGDADCLPFVRAFATISILTFLLLASLFVFGAPVVVRSWLELGALDHDAATFAIRMLGLVVAAAVLKSFLTSILMGLQRHGYYNLVESVGQAALQGGVIGIVHFTGRLDGVLYWYLVHAVGTLSIYAILSGRFLGAACLIPLPSLAPLRESLGFKLNIMAGSLLGAIQKRFDTIALSKLLPIGEMGFYAAIFNIASKASLPAVAIGQAAYPAFSSLISQGDVRALHAKYRVVNDVAVVTSMLAAGFLAFAAKPLLGFMFGAEALPRLLPPFGIILLGFLLSSFVSVPWMISLAAGKPGITTLANLPSLAFMPFSFLLISLLHLNGAGASWVAYNVLYCVFAIPRICRQCLAIPAAHWFRNIGAYVLGGLAAYGTPWLLFLVTENQSWMLGALLFAGGTLAFTVYAFFFVLSPESKSAIRAVQVRLGVPPLPNRS